MSYEHDQEPVETGGPEDRLLTWNRVHDVTGLSRSTAWRLQRLGDFPEQVRISLNRVGWWESELTAWKETRKLRRPRRPQSLMAPRAPKLIETARSVRAESDEATPGALAKSPSKLLKRKRSGRAAHVDQIDFGF